MRTRRRKVKRMSAIELTKADSGGEFKVRQGDVVTLRLDENPTTGYEWSVGDIESDVLKVEKSDYAQRTSGLGSGGQRVVTLGAQKAGSERIELALRRPWDGPGQAVERFTATIHVSGRGE